MSDTNTLIFKHASEDWEYEQIHALNYQTFVEEIPQHQPNEQNRLVDKYHQQNTYIICLTGTELVAMIALRDKRPFSLDAKLDDLDNLLPAGDRLIEYRLLAVKQQYRNTKVFTGIMSAALELSLDRGYDLAVISGTLRQTRLYTRLGFVPFGPRVGSGDAVYQPMYIDVSQAMALFKKTTALRSKSNSSEKRSQGAPVHNYLPGPVTIEDAVLKEYAKVPRSHRSQSFIDKIDGFKQQLLHAVNAENVQILTGSGTLANDIVASQLSLLAGQGLVLVNGEFGERLHDHATRARLSFDSVQVELGESFSKSDIEQAIQKLEQPEWLWVVHCETSSGVMNDLDMLRLICDQHGLKLCLDAVSSIGACHVDLRHVYLATAVSGKGIGALAGLAMIFHRSDLAPAQQRLPRYFDLDYYQTKDGVPFTVSSNAMDALMVACRFDDWVEKFEQAEQCSNTFRQDVLELGLSIVGTPENRSTHITTIALPASTQSYDFGRQLEKEGIFISYNSEYLLKRNHIQICLMGDFQPPAAALIYYLRQSL